VNIILLPHGDSKSLVVFDKILGCHGVMCGRIGGWDDE
jgi:hypothetical protein